MPYKLYLTLRQKAALKIAILFWKKIEVKEKATEFFKFYDKLENSKVQKEWCKFTKAVIEEWSRDLLPQKLEVELIHIVKMIGKTIFNWYQYIKYEYETEEQLITWIDEIHWTPYGTVDPVQTFKSYWLNNPNLDITKVYHFACSHTIEDSINTLWDKIPANIKKNFYSDMYACFDQHILIYWKHCRDNDLSNLIIKFRTVGDELHFNTTYLLTFDLLYNLDHSIEENMMRLSVYHGYYVAVKYFWEKLTEREKNENVLKCARIAVTRYNYYEINENIRNYKQSQYVEICIFFIDQMSKHHKKAFFNEGITFWGGPRQIRILDAKDEILRMLLSVWPWQELFMPVLKDILLYQDNESQMFCEFLNSITVNILENYLLYHSVENCPYRSLLRKAWLIIPEFIKRKIKPQYYRTNFIADLLYALDLDSLKLIFCDPDIATVRDEFINIGFDLYIDLILEDQFDKLNELNRHCSIPGEKSFKNSINHIGICENFIVQSDYELLNKFLDWMFNTEEEKRNFKDDFKSNPFSSRWVSYIWRNCNKDITIAMNESYEFLHWLLESEEEIALFKKGIVVMLERDRSTVFNMRSVKRNGMMDDFVSWCSFGHEEIQRLKQIMSQVERNA